MSFAAILLLLGVYPATGGDTASQDLVHTEGQAEFKKADTDASGQLTEGEFLSWWTVHKKSVGEYIDFHAKSDPNGVKIPGLFRENVKQTEAKTLSFWEALVNSLAMIIVTELGDKTFFIAAILSMRHGPVVIFCGAMTALAIMTVLGVGVGFVLPTLLPRQYTHIAATLLFVYFGLKLLKEGCEMLSKGEGNGPSDELEEVEKEMEDKGPDADDAEGGAAQRSDSKKDKQNNKMQKIYWQALSLTFIAEWGDRSQIATIALAAAKDPLGVIIGGVVGHSLCTGLACVGGKVIAGRISERNMLIIGGIIFLCFAVHAVIAGPAE
jgi:putative Ca2+/H+ antiporter (TMEM165/GDT1 family)